MLVISGGLATLLFVATNRFIERHLNRAIAYGLTRWANLQVRDYVAILQLQNGYAVTELRIEPQDWLAGKSLIDLKLPQEGVLVLGIRREEGTWLGTPTGDMEVHPGDTLTLYGPIHRVEELDQRRRGKRGEEAHQEAIIRHGEALEEQEEIDDLLQGVREEDAEDSSS